MLHCRARCTGCPRPHPSAAAPPRRSPKLPAAGGGKLYPNPAAPERAEERSPRIGRDDPESRSQKASGGLWGVNERINKALHTERNIRNTGSIPPQKLRSHCVSVHLDLEAHDQYQW